MCLSDYQHYQKPHLKWGILLSDGKFTPADWLVPYSIWSDFHIHCSSGLGSVTPIKTQPNCSSRWPNVRHRAGNAASAPHGHAGNEMEAHCAGRQHQSCTSLTCSTWGLTSQAGHRLSSLSRKSSRAVWDKYVKAPISTRYFSLKYHPYKTRPKTIVVFTCSWAWSEFFWTDPKPHHNKTSWRLNTL